MTSQAPLPAVETVLYVFNATFFMQINAMDHKDVENNTLL